MNRTNPGQFLAQLQANLQDYLKAYAYDDGGNLMPVRSCFCKLKKHALDFAKDASDEKILLLPGMRGVGKTTILAQMYYLEKYLSDPAESAIAGRIKNRVYVSCDDLRLNSLSLKEFVEAYETRIGVSFQNLQEKTLLLIDEVHYGERWSLLLKVLYDRTKGHNNLLIMATGSSALLLQSNPDLARRAKIERIRPLDFCEYASLKHDAKLDEAFRADLAKKVFHSKNAAEVFGFLKTHEQIMLNFWSQIPENFEIVSNGYFEYGSFPFGISSKNKASAMEKIRMVAERIIEKEVPELKKFDAETIAKLPKIVHILSNSDAAGLHNISKSVPIQIDTLRRALDALEKSGMLMRLPSWGKVIAQVRKPSKYLFLSPSIRISLLRGFVPPELKGKQLEDYCALVFSERLPARETAGVFYDCSQEGADFIIKFADGRKIVMEVGFSKENPAQIEFTSGKVRPAYGLLVGSRRCELLKDSIVKIPLLYWLLI